MLRTELDGLMFASPTLIDLVDTFYVHQAESGLVDRFHVHQGKSLLVDLFCVHQPTYLFLEFFLNSSAIFKTVLSHVIVFSSKSAFTDFANYVQK